MTNEIVRINCLKDDCGTFPMDRALYNRYKRTGDTWSCPNGHRQYFTESTEQPLREKISRLQTRIDSILNSLDRERDEKHKHKNAKLALRDELITVKRQDNPDGVLELYDDHYVWVCECGSNGVKPFGEEREAWDAYDGHRERMHEVGGEATA